MSKETGTESRERTWFVDDEFGFQALWACGNISNGGRSCGGPVVDNRRSVTMNRANSIVTRMYHRPRQTVTCKVLDQKRPSFTTSRNFKSLMMHVVEDMLMICRSKS